MNLAELSIAELQELQANIEKEIQVRRAAERDRLKKQFQEQAQAVGLTLDEIFGKGPAGKGAAKVKFRDPEDPSKTWAGRGRKPVWLVDAIAAGRDIEEFRV
jgi:DNA-binding protein H-NS